MSAAPLPKLSDRTSGLLLHPTSLPGASDNGDLGPEARAFVDFLVAADQRWWQMLPVGPPGYGNSPYSAESAFAGSPALVSIDRLIDDGLLSSAQRGQPRGELLRAAFAAFRAGGGAPEAEHFAAAGHDWLDDYALYRALKRAHGDRQWTHWPSQLRDREPQALTDAAAALSDELAFARFVQWRFSGDWRALRAYAHARGVALIGDLPIFVAHDSADVWQHRDLYTLDETTGDPALVAGVPPDYFSATGQRWGNPLYRWDRMRTDGYAWWIARFRATLSTFDAVRLDHFIGFVRYWEIPGDEPTAVNGHWREGPGAAFFAAVRAALAHEAKGASPPRPGAKGAESSEGSASFELPLIAEDLGAMTPEVHALRDQFGFPGIKVLQFAFGADPSAPDFIPHNYPRRAVVYTGTHDNDTTWGWFHDPGSRSSRSPEQAEHERQTTLRYLGAGPEGATDIHWRMIRLMLMSVANVAIIPVQDLLGLGSEARMNRPGVEQGNWSFRLTPGALTPALAERLRELTTTYGRGRAA